jgi:hypothetical protein
MSISVNTSINRNLPVSDAGTSSVIKNNGAKSSEVQPQQFSALVQQGAAKNEVVTSEEKQFFEGLFPQAAPSIRSYSGYSVSGQRTQVSLGTIIDAKG